MRTRDTTITLDHLQVDADSVRGRTVTSRSTDTPSDVVLARGQVAGIEQVEGGHGDLALAVLPFAIAAALIAIFRAGYGSD